MKTIKDRLFLTILFTSFLAFFTQNMFSKENIKYKNFELKKKYKNLTGCCSWHDGVLKKGYKVYTKNNRVVCKDLTISKSCIL